MDDSSPKNSSTDRKYWFGIVACTMLVAATVVRILGARGDLWLDEIWALDMARQVSSPLDVFTKLHHEINHYLYTLYFFYFVGPQSNWLVYRIPSLAPGVGTVILAGLIGRRRSLVTGFLAMFLVGFSYMLIHYSSEMRGYSAAVFFSFLSFYLLEGYLERPSWPLAMMFSISTILGLASHLIFANTLFAALAWSVYRLPTPRFEWKRMMAGLIPCYALPLVFLAALYVADIRRIEVGGGSLPLSFIDTYGTSLSWAMGSPVADVLKFLACLVAIGLFDAGIRLLRQEKSDAFVFFIGVILVFPVLLAVVRGSVLVYIRHFIIGIAFLLILFSFVLASLFQQGRRGKAVCFIFLAVYFLANGWHTMDFLKYGRGQYREALRFLAGHSEASPVTIGSDEDFRVSFVLKFYAREAMTNRPVKYYARDAWPQQGPEWFISNSPTGPPPPAFHITDDAGNQYDFVKTYPTAPLSGSYWFVYHNRGKRE